LSGDDLENDGIVLAAMQRFGARSGAGGENVIDGIARRWCIGCSRLQERW
jgi:hypothetical protein